MSKSKSPARRSRAEWSKLVEECERSGLDRRAFADREGLHAGTFGWWASRLSTKRTKARSASATDFVPVRIRVPEVARSVAKTAPAVVSRETPVPSAVELVLTNGRRLRLDLGQTNDPRLVALIAIVESSARC